MEQTILRPETTDTILKECCQTAARWGAGAVCVRPCDVSDAKRLLHGSDVRVCTMISFPHGGAKTPIKVAEVNEALEDGADEIELMPNIGCLNSEDFDRFEQDIKAVALTTYRRSVLLKVVLETCYVSERLRRIACRICEKAGADYIVTSTGYGTAGASAGDIPALLSYIEGGKMKIKAAGGIKTLDSALDMLGAGASRIATGFVQTILEEASARQREGALEITRR